MVPINVLRFVVLQQDTGRSIETFCVITVWKLYLIKGGLSLKRPLPFETMVLPTLTGNTELDEQSIDKYV